MRGAVMTRLDNNVICNYDMLYGGTLQHFAFQVNNIKCHGSKGAKLYQRLYVSKL